MKKVMNSTSFKYTCQVRLNLLTYAVFGWLHRVGVLIGTTRFTLWLLDFFTYKMPRNGYAVQEMRARRRAWIQWLLYTRPLK